jgi:hypothetical protein
MLTRKPARPPAGPTPLALWLAVPILTANLAITLCAFFASANVPLDVLLADGGEAMIAIGVFLGLSDLLLATLFIVAIRRIRTRVVGRAAGSRRPAGRYLLQPL